MTALAHREKLPETTAALSIFLSGWDQAMHWIDFELLVKKWKHVAEDGLDTDRVGVFWALLFLSSQGKVELEQIKGSLYAPLKLKRILEPGTFAQLPLQTLNVPAATPAAA